MPCGSEVHRFQQGRKTNVEARLIAGGGPDELSPLSDSRKPGRLAPKAPQDEQGFEKEGLDMPWPVVRWPVRQDRGDLVGLGPNLRKDRQELIWLG